MVGLPRSGKSTVANDLGFPVVSSDAIRMAMHGTAFRPEAEPLVWGLARTMVQALFLSGHDDVALDSTNHTKARRRIWDSTSWMVRYRLVDTSEEECIQRANYTNQPILIPIIRRMAAQWEPIEGEDS